MGSSSPESFGRTRAAAASGSECAFRAMQQAFERALETRPEAVRTLGFAFAGRPVRMRVLGRDLSEGLCRPFAHLADAAPSPANPQLTVDSWDEQGAAVSWWPPASGAASESAFPFEDGVFRSSPDGRFVLYEKATSLSGLDRAEGRMVGWWREGRSLSVDDRAKPLSALLSLWHADHGALVIHGSMVCKGGRGLLFAGPAGSGKSTAALACLCAGFQYLGDDYVGLEVAGDGACLGHSLYDSVRLAPEHLARFPELAAHAVGGRGAGSEKALAFASQAFPGRSLRSAPICVLALPRVAGGAECRAVPVSKGKALLRLAYSSLRIPPSPQGAMERLAGLVERVPTYWLELGGRVDEIARCAERLLTEA